MLSNLISKTPILQRYKFNEDWWKLSSPKRASRSALDS
jgi:hypothetical protein